MTPGQICYEGYCQQSGGKSLVSGAALPAWPDLPADIKEAWERAASAVIMGVDVY